MAWHSSISCGAGWAEALYEALDFEPISIRKNYYDDPREDAVIMIKKVYE